jgi:hypothetical protein
MYLIVRSEIWQWRQKLLGDDSGIFGSGCQKPAVGISPEAAVGNGSGTQKPAVVP